MELEFESAEEDSSSDEEVFLGVVRGGDWRLVLLSLHEFAADSAAVLVADLVHLDGVVTAVEGNDEFAVLVIGLGGNELAVESEDVHVLLEHLLHVELGSLWLEGNNATHGVFLGSVAHVWLNSLVLHLRSRLAELERNLCDSFVLLVPSLGVVVTVVDKALTSINVNFLTASQVEWSVVFFGSEGHAWAVSENGCFGEHLLLKEHWEGESATVLGVDLLDFDLLVGQEVVETVVLLAAIVTVVVPEDSEGKNVAVVVEEALQVLVGATTLQLDLVVVLELSKIGRVLLHVDHGTRVDEGIVWEALWGSDITSFVGEVGLCEFVAVDDSEYS